MSAEHRGWTPRRAVALLTLRRVDALSLTQGIVTAAKVGGDDARG